MGTNKTLRNVVIALILLVQWGNIVSLLLPADQYGSIIKIVDFSTVLFLVVILIAMFNDRRGGSGEGGGENTHPESEPADDRS